MKSPKSWEDLTIKEFSRYNTALSEFLKSIKDFPEDSKETPSKILIEEIKLNFKVLEIFAGLTEDEALSVDIAIAKGYSDDLSFLMNKYEPTDIDSFNFKGTKYTFPKNIGLNTKFGQYVEALQSEMAASHLDDKSILYLSHQIAHVVEFDNNKWNGKERDILAKTFEELPCSVAFDFGFFLEKKYQIYSQAYLEYEIAGLEKRLTFTKRITAVLVGLKRYMNWRSLMYLKNLTILRLIVFYIQTRERYSNIYRILLRNLTMSQK